ncbi:MAG TPA: alkaline phosphatase family protein, partial [Terriglobia bacterium]|nr:alkaline phosphatase family protein [Terriglobia bacterium]
MKRVLMDRVLRSKPRLTLLLFFSWSCLAHAEVQRLVLLKADGVPFQTLDRFVREQQPETGKSLLPWIDQVFYEGGSRLSNFYVRGISLSAPSWSLLDTGQHLQIKGNIEFDRFTLRTYDYLNFLTFFFSYSAGRQLDMPATELLDHLGVPLLLDAFPTTERHLSFQLLQRGSSLTTLQKGLRKFLFGRTPRDWLDEWAMGFAKHSIVFDQLERELLKSLDDPQIRYLDYYTPRFDHVSHLNRDRESQLSALQEIDRLVGKVWTAIGRTPQAASTVLVLVSDHGTNSDETIYSQGFNLIELLASGRGGAHHVISKRPLLADYTLKSLSPTVPLVTTTSQDSAYLKGQSSGYPTALIDLDGNERAS